MGLASAALGSLGLDVLKVNAETGFPAQEEFARVGNAQGTLLIGDRCLGYMLGADAASAGIALGDAWRARALFPEDGLSHVLTSVSYGQYLEVLACASDASLTALQGCRTPYALGYILPLDIYCPLDGCGS
ncbi:hypothetical protein COY28_01285 [Candidatus Woesearchaeota archaeon CG_4_10_14_0_2_um_filter_57_5]|nr:MAG: hypothetical protein AUJ68_06975 [Candidatus Woesearchaeota archaeon CG1_02_57_44]PIZ56079.1 MAG: hypothetical protein COY28_01285 [Candidatus Woesearchaeota archaeon CG_4_10_14_0_2_um_filter_57_5]